MQLGCLFGLAGFKRSNTDEPIASDRLLFHASSAKLVKTSRAATKRWLLNSRDTGKVGGRGVPHTGWCEKKNVGIRNASK